MANFPTVQGLGGSLQDALKDKVQIHTTTTGNLQHIRYDRYSGDWTYGKDPLYKGFTQPFIDKMKGRVSG